MNQFLQANGWEIARLTFEHLWLTLSAMLLAAAIGLPLGVLLTRHERLAKPVIAVANIIPTIPSLALFGLLLPVPWLGENAARLAILALTGYALLPILRNTYAGIRSVDPALEDVARALGMTSWQRLTKVELPLAASVILAGLRTATVTCVGVATIAAAIGAGGLGQAFFAGAASAAPPPPPPSPLAPTPPSASSNTNPPSADETRRTTSRQRAHLGRRGCA